jgi:PKD repeat protein
MAAPVANFSYSENELSVQFTDSSLNVPTSWAWNFGDIDSGMANTSTLQNPVHVFSLPGSYTITVTVTNVDGSSVKTLTIHVGQGRKLLSISEMIDCRIPAGMTIDSLCKENYIKIEQLYLQPLMDPEIDDESLFNENEWPPLANALIAELVAYKLILDEVNKIILVQSNTSSTSSSSGSAGLKKLVTGPSEAEWYNNTEAANEFISSTFKSGSTFEKTTVATICSLSKRLKIKHPLCENTYKYPVLFRIVS